MTQTKWPPENTGRFTSGDGWRVYSAGGCRFAALIKSQKVRAFRLAVSDRCSFNWADFVSEYNFVTRSPGPAPAPQKMSLGDVAWFGYDDSVRTSCLNDCGNAADPVFWVYAKGPHSFDWLEVVAAGEPTSGEFASFDKQASEGRLKKSTSCFWELSEGWDHQLDPAAVELINSAPVRWIAIGYDLNDQGCEWWPKDSLLNYAP